MKKIPPSPSHYRNLLYSAIAFFYFLPILAHASYYSFINLVDNAWNIFTCGLLISISGTVSLFFLFHRWESAIREHASSIIKLKVKKNIPKQTPRETTVLLPEIPENNSSLHLRKPSNTSSPITPYLLLEQQEEKKEQIRSLESLLQEQQKATEELAQELNQKNQTLKQLYLDLDDLSKQVENGEAKFHDFQIETQKQLTQKDSLINEYQHTISEQRTVIEKKHKTICKLENKTRNLSYEIKTLLQLGESPSEHESSKEKHNETESHPLMEVFDSIEYRNDHNEQTNHPISASSNKEIHTPYDASMHLQNCIEKAQKLRGINHLSGKTSRFSTMPFEHYAIDLRRLFDSFREENSSTVFVYSQEEHKLLFVNNHVKSILGWTPEKFITDFNHLVQKGMKEWKESLKNLQQKRESQTRLLVQAKSGEDVLIHCHLGLIKNGTFTNHVIGILFPV